MKLAIPTDDGKKVSAHFGEAKFMLVVRIAGGEILERQLREVGDDGVHDHEHNHPHSGDQLRRHRAKFDVIADCDMLIARGMGQPAYERLQEMGLDVVATDLKEVEEVLQAALQGRLVHNPRRIHKAHH